MTDWIDRLNWIKHDGGPQPVTDDVFVAIVTQKHSCRDIVIVPAGPCDCGGFDGSVDNTP